MIADPFLLLPPFEWRGVVYPVTAREVSFQHEGARHRFQFKDGAAIEQLGSEPLTFSYTIPMREGIAVGPYKELFSKGLKTLLQDIQNRTRDLLVDPVYGPFNCVPTSYRDSTDMNRRDGVDIAVEFAVSLEPGDDAGPADIPTTSSIFSEAGSSTLPSGTPSSSRSHPRKVD